MWNFQLNIGLAKISKQKATTLCVKNGYCPSTEFCWWNIFYIFTMESNTWHLRLRLELTSERLVVRHRHQLINIIVICYAKCDASCFSFLLAIIYTESFQYNRFNMRKVQSVLRIMSLAMDSNLNFKLNYAISMSHSREMWFCGIWTLLVGYYMLNLMPIEECMYYHLIQILKCRIDWRWWC